MMTAMEANAEAARCLKVANAYRHAAEAMSDVAFDLPDDVRAALAPLSEPEKRATLISLQNMIADRFHDDAHQAESRACGLIDRRE
jgi:hypothetical protein